MAKYTRRTLNIYNTLVQRDAEKKPQMCAYSFDQQELT